MNRILSIVSGVLLFVSASALRAAEFQVHGVDGSGRAGERVFVELVYEYGARFAVIAEDFELAYPGDVLALDFDRSTIDLFGVTRSLNDHVGELTQFAGDHQGSVLEHRDIPFANALSGYFLSFYVADGASQVRSGQVRLRAAFEVVPTAAPGGYAVLLTNKNQLVDENENEFVFPAALPSLNVTVISSVPEPGSAGLLLFGLACVAGGVCRRARLERHSTVHRAEAR